MVMSLRAFIGWVALLMLAGGGWLLFSPVTATDSRGYTARCGSATGPMPDWEYRDRVSADRLRDALNPVTGSAGEESRREILEQLRNPIIEPPECTDAIYERRIIAVPILAVAGVTLIGAMVVRRGAPPPGMAPPVAPTGPAPAPRGSAPPSPKTAVAHDERPKPTASAPRRGWLLPTAFIVALLFGGVVAVLAWGPWESRQSNSDGTTSAPAATSPPPRPPRVSNAMEKNFVHALRAAPGASLQHISWSMIPGGGADTRNDDALLVAHGYEACGVMDRFPAVNRQDVAYTFYSEQGFNMESLTKFPEHKQEMTAYMDYAARYLCQRNSASSSTVQAP